ncbi:MAG TPA: hypothetical protein VLJ61_06315 [Pyrinomonadaceae bacterium]|nr:hypothetical protein [Pyrinomonadaceae bacterium]
MLRVSARSLMLSLMPLLAAALLAFAAQGARAQNAAAPVADKDGPPFHDYKGVHIGMTTEEARKKLGNPADKGDAQDFYSFNDKESAQLYYDSDHKVFAIAVTYLGSTIAPEPKLIVGSDADKKDDGSLYKMVRFPKAGCWVSYLRTNGDSPMTIVTLQKLQP